jgi:hypothetical protein
VIRNAFILALGAGLLAAPSLAQTSDVGPGHWAYQAVQDLAAKGLVLGYPDGKFLGARTLTRYEMATLIKRVVDRLENKPAPTPSLAPAVAPPVAPSATPEELAELRRLVEEYKTELTVIGTDLQGIKDRLDTQDGKITSLEEAVNDPEGTVQATAATVAKMGKTTIDGYLQARWESRSDGKDNLLPGGTLANQNNFYIRENRIRIRHTFKDNNQMVFQVDAAKGNNVVIKDSYVTTPLMRARSLDIPLTLWAGQFNIPFGFEIQQSSSEREFPERSRGERTFFKGERDRGIKLEGSLAGNAWQYQLGVINGNGINDGDKVPGSASTTYTYVDTNSHKDLVGHLLYEPPTGKMAIGASVYSGKGSAATGELSSGKEVFGLYDKTRYGAEFRYYGIPEFKIQGEYVRGKDYNAGRKVNGVVDGSANIEYWYAQILRNIGKANAIGFRYDVYDPDTNSPVAGEPLASYQAIPTWAVMAQRFLTESTRLTLAFESPRLPKLAGANRPKQDLMTVQLQYKY